MVQTLIPYNTIFVNLVEILHKRIENEEYREILKENIDEENGIYDSETLKKLESHGIMRKDIDGITHTNLYQRMFEPLGIKYSEDLKNTNETEIFIQDLQNKMKNENILVSLGTLGFAAEEIVPVLYKKITDAFDKTDLKSRDYVFYPLHVYIDEGHGDKMIQILTSMLPKD
eukprot:UN28679